MKTIVIQNWNELKEQFGLVDKKENGVLSARELSTELKKKIDINNPEHTAITYGKGEGIALFKLIAVSPNDIVFEYIGTAN